ncbi:MAG: glyoxalase [Rhodobacteraceae bacterium]|nr:MAG: glyoxalase [Paracoccaceae bacterium]
MKMKFHHINYVSKNVDELNNFYTKIMGLNTLPAQNFIRTGATTEFGYDGTIKFVTDGQMQMHLAEKGLTIAAKNNRHINPVERGHIAFRTDNIDEFKDILDREGVLYADYGTTFSQEWHQVFFYDPEGNVIEVHQVMK